MAFDKAVDSVALETGLTTIADAIRAKGGTAEPLEFPQGMADAVEAIPIGGDKTTENQLIEGGLTEYTNSDITLIRYSAFAEYKSLRKLICPNVKSVGLYALSGCIFDILQLPKCETMSGNSMEQVKGPARLILPRYNDRNPNLSNNDRIEYIDVGSSDSTASKLELYNYIRNCPKLTTFIIRTPRVIYSYGPELFTGTPIDNGAGYFYVPRSLVDQYKVATNWVTFASQIRAIEDYPEITGGVK